MLNFISMNCWRIYKCELLANKRVVHFSPLELSTSARSSHPERLCPYTFTQCFYPHHFTRQLSALFSTCIAIALSQSIFNAHKTTKIHRIAAMDKHSHDTSSTQAAAASTAQSTEHVHIINGNQAATSIPVVVAVNLVGENVGAGLGRAHWMAIATVSGDDITSWDEYEVAWDIWHDQGAEGTHHARIVRFLREHGVQAVVTGHAGPPMINTMLKLGVLPLLGATGPARSAVIAGAHEWRAQQG